MRETDRKIDRKGEGEREREGVLIFNLEYAI